MRPSTILSTFLRLAESLPDESRRDSIDRVPMLALLMRAVRGLKFGKRTRGTTSGLRFMNRRYFSLTVTIIRSLYAASAQINSACSMTVRVALSCISGG